MKNFFESPYAGEIMTMLAYQCRKAYRNALILDIIKKTLCFVIIIMSFIALIKVFNVSNVFLAIWLILIATTILLDSIRIHAYHTQTEKECGKYKEFFLISEKIAEIIQLPEYLLQLNNKLDSHSFQLFQNPSGGCIIAIRVYMQQFPIAVLTDEICNIYIEKAVDPDENSFSYTADLNLDELKVHPAIIRFNMKEEDVEKAKHDSIEDVEKSIESKQELIDYCRLSVIDRKDIASFG